jgi:hypothetical protein
MPDNLGSLKSSQFGSTVGSTIVPRVEDLSCVGKIEHSIGAPRLSASLGAIRSWLEATAKLDVPSANPMTGGSP